MQQAIEYLNNFNVECEPVRIDELTGGRAIYVFKDPDGFTVGTLSMGRVNYPIF